MTRRQQKAQMRRCPVILSARVWGRLRIRPSSTARLLRAGRWFVALRTMTRLIPLSSLVNFFTSLFLLSPTSPRPLPSHTHHALWAQCELKLHASLQPINDSYHTYGMRASPFRQVWKGGRHPTPNTLVSCIRSRFPSAEAADGCVRTLSKLARTGEK